MCFCGDQANAELDFISAMEAAHSDKHGKILGHTTGLARLFSAPQKRLVGRTCREVFDFPQCRQCACETQPPEICVSEPQRTPSKSPQHTTLRRFSLICRPLDGAPHKHVQGRIHLLYPGKKMLQPTSESAPVAHLSGLQHEVTYCVHELSNYLTAIAGHAQLLCTALPSETETDAMFARLRHHAETVHRAVQTSLEILERTRSTLQRGHDTAPAPFLRLCLSQVLENSAATVSAEMQRLCVSFFPDIPPNLPPVQGDELLLEQAFVNLLINAAQAATSTAPSPPKAKPCDRSHPRVELQANATADSIRVTIRDNGPGLPTGHEMLIFDPFFTTKKGVQPVGSPPTADASPPTAHAPTGARLRGLGLSLVRHCIALHGGRVTARNVENGGTRFDVQLPTV
jgi:signal transduction histidine kinase